MGEVLQGSIVVERSVANGNRLTVTQAPPTAYLTLEMFAHAEALEFKVTGREISIAGQITYRVTGWDDVQSCLTLERIGGGV